MNILFLHNNFPGQYRRIASYLAGMDGVQMVAATLPTNQQAFKLRRVDYKPHREVTEKIHPTLVTMERAILTAQAAFQSLYKLKESGFTPDLICAHSGWGPSLLMKELFPSARLLTLYEWYYNARGSDADFLDDVGHDAAARTHFKNLPILADLAVMDWGTSPTRWQWSQFPQRFQRDISVLHEGVDCTFFAPGEASLTVGERTFVKGDEVITYVARGMEPYRGFPQFMEAVAKLQKRRPNLHVLIAGNDRVAYGRKRADGKTYREHAMETLDLDAARVHFLGLVPLSTLQAMFRLTKAHVYLTVPFVLSWSMLEAMATGAVVVGSDTAPVRELIADDVNGVLTDFFDVDAIAARIEGVLSGEVDSQKLSRAARETILADYDTRSILPRQWALMRSVAREGQPR
ncbi:MAG: glycosyltransferase [Pseudomonadota bacterium]